MPVNVFTVVIWKLWHIILRYIALAERRLCGLMFEFTSALISVLLDFALTLYKLLLAAG